MIPAVMPMHFRQLRAAIDASIEVDGMPLRAFGIQIPTRTTPKTTTLTSGTPETTT